MDAVHGRLKQKKLNGLVMRHTKTNFGQTPGVPERPGGVPGKASTTFTVGLLEEGYPPDVDPDGEVAGRRWISPAPKMRH